MGIFSPPNAKLTGSMGSGPLNYAIRALRGKHSFAGSRPTPIAVRGNPEIKTSRLSVVEITLF